MPTRKPHLKQIDPPASFEEVDSTVNRWQVGIRDTTDSFQDSVWFACSLSKWKMEDLIKAGGRECQNGEGIVIVSKLVKGLVTEWGIFQVRYFFDQWHLEKMRGT